MVDGAILENVPVQAMRGRLGKSLERRLGIGTIIALDVDVKEELTIDPTIKSLKRRHVIRARFDKKAARYPAWNKSCPMPIKWGAWHSAGGSLSRTAGFPFFYDRLPKSLGNY